MGSLDRDVGRQYKYGVDAVTFWSRVQKTETCWIFTGAKNGAGYGNVLYEGKNRLAHRLSYELRVGTVPAGMFVIHSCDNPPCVNPAHLRVGTNADNMADMDARGRRVLGGVATSPLTGERHPMKRPDVRAKVAASMRLRRGLVPRGGKHVAALLTDEQAAEIRSRLAAGTMGKTLAAELGVSRGTISRIRTGDTYRL